MKIKPTGLKGGDKIQRIQNLMGKLAPLNESTTNSSLEHMKYGSDGIAYAIIRENHTYFIKTSDKTNKNLIAEDFDYIGGLQNKMDESYRSYEDALRHLNMKFKDLNESYGIRENIDLFRTDFLTETKKMKTEQDSFKLKVDVPKSEPVEKPIMDEPTTEPMAELPEAPSEPVDMDTTDISDEAPEETEVSDTEEDSDDLEKDIQRLTGKIGQKMRELDKPNPELEKYVINSIMSALDVDSMDEDFKEDLIDKLEGDGKEEEETEVEVEEEPTEESGSEEATEEVEESVKVESKIISKKTLMENLKSKKINEFFFKGDEYGMKSKYKGHDINDDKSEPKLRWATNPNLKDDDDYIAKKTFKKDLKAEKDRAKFNSFKRSKMIDDEELLGEIEKMDVFSTPSEFTSNVSALKKGNYGIKDPKTGHIKSISVNEEDETIYELELDEDWMEEGNKFTKMLAKTKKGGTFKIGDREYKDTSDYDKHESRRKFMDEDDEMDFEFEKEEMKPLHKKPYDLKKFKKFDDELEEDFNKDFYVDEDGNDIADELEIKSNKPTTAPPPVITPTKTPRRDKPFKPQIKPKIEPKGGYIN